MNREPLEDIERDLLLEGLRRVHGHDFRGYAPAFLERRLKGWMAGRDFPTLSHAQAALLRDPELYASFLGHIAVPVSEMFRDPAFFRALRTKVIPCLRTWPSVKIWHAGCAHGEEVYSMAILLHEEQMQGRYQIYATDIDERILEQAREGIFHLRNLKDFTRLYHEAGGRGEFADYYTARYDRAMMRPFLREHILFTSHDLATAGTFGEMHLILCRNVMIYFASALKARVFHLLDSSLAPGGFLCLGLKESLLESGLEERLDAFDEPLRIFRKGFGRSSPLPPPESHRSPMSA